MILIRGLKHRWPFKFNMAVLIKIILAVLFFLCLLQMPYAFFQGVRFLALLGFLFLGYQAYKEKKIPAMWVYFALALLFQPFLKIALGRILWNVVDVIVGVGLVISLFRPQNKTP